MAEDVFVLDCHSYIFVWVGQEVDFLMKNLSRETTIFTVSEGSEPQIFTRFFTWDSAKSLVCFSFFVRVVVSWYINCMRLL